MVTWIKKMYNFQIAKVHLRVLLSFCLIFCQSHSLVMLIKVLLMKKAFKGF